MAFIHTLSPLPAEILQGQKQLVNYKGSCYFYSPYETLEQRVEFLLGTSKIESFSRKPEPIVRKGSKIIVGVYKNIKPYSKTSFGIHYKNDNAFITMTNVLREIEVSH